MTITSILVLVGDDLAASPALAAAVAVARPSAARLIGLYVPPEPAPSGAARRTADEREAAFVAHCSGEAVACDWISGRGPAAERLARHSAYADLVAVATGDPAAAAGVLSRPELSSLVLAAGAPVLAVPEGWGRPFGLDTVVVAWNGRKEAAGALRDALPLLVHAGRVIVLEVRPPGQHEAPDRHVLDHLGRHGVRAEALINFAATAEAPAAILAQVRAHRADLLVMGAYGHARLREMVLGGVTEHVVANAGGPVLLSR
ncbi:universal stress protein [Azospirillum sp. ST 5-10]|uniref:universal stress protein n=1 Tax=unclassified Azospirillum TaxID=2630922 RepID=UPI003F4A6B17